MFQFVCKIKKIIQCLILLWMGLSLSSCSRLHLFSSLADEYLAYEVASEFDLSRTQKKQLQPTLDKFFLDLKTKLAPKIIATSDELKGFFEKPENLKRPSSEILPFIQNQRLQIYQWKYDLLAITKDRIEEVSQVIKLENWNALKENFAEKTQELRNKKNRTSEIAKTLEYFVGDLTEQQEKRIELWKKDFPPQKELRIENREFVFKKFETNLNQFSQGNFLKTTILFLAENDNWQLPSYQAYNKKKVESIEILISELIPLMTEKQIKKVKQRFGEIRAEALEFSQSRD